MTAGAPASGRRSATGAPRNSRSSGEPQAEQLLQQLHAERQLSALANLIVRQYGPGIAGYLATVVRDRALWQDAFSEFAEELWKALPRYRGEGSFRSWSYAIAHRCALRQLRAARRRPRPLRDSEASKLAAQIRSISLSVSRARRAAGVEKLRALLSPDEQALLSLRVDREMSWIEVSEVFGRGDNPAALRKRFERIKQRLQTAALRQGLLPSRKSGSRAKKS